MKELAIFIFAAGLCGCAIPQPGMTRGNPWAGFGAKRSSVMAQPAAAEYVDEVIDVVTEPPGARIHVNDAFVGHAPVRYAVRRLWRGSPGYMVLDSVKVEALPVAGGQCVQSGVFGEASRKVASPVTFNMAACAPAPQPAGGK